MPTKEHNLSEQMKVRASDLTIFKRATITDMATDVGHEELRPSYPMV